MDTPRKQGINIICTLIINEFITKNIWGKILLLHLQIFFLIVVYTCTKFLLKSMASSSILQPPPPTSFKLVNKHIPIILNPQSHPITLFCNNNEAVAQSKDPRNHKKGKHIERKYHIIRDIVARGNIVVAKIDNANNLVDSFTKALLQRIFESHLEGMWVKSMHNSL